jgi:putative RNA 2'-phosphotransferase
MNDRQRTRASKFLSKHLRHDPTGLGLTLEPGGWVAVDALLDGCRRAGTPLSRDELAEIVAGSDKQRFGFDETGTCIRANQGHSVEVDLRLEPAEPPAVLFHGTGADTVPVVLREGLRKMRRHHVHLSPDIETATRVGARHGRPVVLAVDAAAMARAGHRFYVSANGVWLTNEVPPAFLRPPEGPTA